MAGNPSHSAILLWKALGVFQALGQRPPEDGLCVEKAIGLEEFIHLIHREEAAAVFREEIDVETVELVSGSVTYALLNQRHLVSGMNIIVVIQTAKHLAKHRDVSHLGILSLDVSV